MNEKELKTSAAQRFWISAVAIILLVATILAYAAVIISGNSSNSTTADSEGIGNEKIAEYESSYNEKEAEFEVATAEDFAKFSKYRSRITAYNETAANNNGVVTEDVVKGSGRELDEEDTDYLAYYVGWCADESVFDSSFNDNDNPTAFSKAISPSNGMIAGWEAGVVGMKLGGIRELTIPGELAYGEDMEICGGYNKPLKFLVMAVANEDPLKTMAEELDLAYLKLYYAYYGIDYDELYGN